MPPTSEKGIEGPRCTACQFKIQLVEDGKMVAVPNETKANKYMKGRKDMNDNNQTEERNYQIRKRDLCRFILNNLSDIREVKWNIEKEALKVLDENERYQQIKNRIIKLEEVYDYLMFHTDYEIRKVIDSLEEDVIKSVDENWLTKSV